MAKKIKNPAGNQNNTPKTDAGTGQVLDNTDNKGVHLNQEENIPGSDVRLDISPTSDPIEGNSNVQEGSDGAISGDSQSVSGASDQSTQEEDLPESDPPTNTEGSDEDANATPSGDIEDEPAASETAEASDDANLVDVEDDAVRSSVATEAGDSTQESTVVEGSGSSSAPESPEVPHTAKESQGAEDVAVSAEEAKELTEGDLRAMYARILPADTVTAWDYNTLYMYHLKKVMPEKTVRGNWPVDIRRTRTMKDWSSDELLDWLEGKIRAPKNVIESDLWDEIYKRYRMPGNWPRYAAKHFVLTGERPAYTANGVLIEDQSRKDKQIGNWTFLELRSALLKEIESNFNDEQLIEQLRVRLGLSQSFSATRLLESLPEMPTEANVDDMLLKSKLDEYKTTMTQSGRSLTETTAAQCQGFLYKAIINVMSREPREFNEGWNILLDWINENYNTLFTDEKARRGTSRLAMSKAAAATFEDILTLMIHTRKPGNRAEAAKLYSLEHILRYVVSEQQRANVIAFYSVM